MTIQSPRLLYDSDCTVCRSFARLLQKNLGDAIVLVPMDPATARTATEFSLEQPDGTVLHGEAAIAALEKAVPAIRDYFWMLPPSYRGKALVRTYRLGKWLRKLWGCRTCNKKD